MTKTKFNLLALTAALVCGINSANAASVYDNNISALNINMLTDTFMSYTDYGNLMSDLFERKAVYGTMLRFDEYGDDGSTLVAKNKYSDNDMFIKDIWANANHINGQVHYSNNTSEHARLNLATVGGTTKSISLKNGRISFGGFASYINTKVPDVKTNGDVVGVFSHYKYRNFGAHTLGNIGSLNNKTSENTDFNNSWVNVATDIYADIELDKTFYVRPSVYVGYTWVSSDNLFVNNNLVSTSDYNFLNLAPSVKFIKEISKDWYGSFSGKYVAHFGGENDIYTNGTTVKALTLENYTDVGVDIEYNLKHFVFGGKVHKQIGGIDGWDSNINVKYVF